MNKLILFLFTPILFSNILFAQKNLEKTKILNMIDSIEVDNVDNVLDKLNEVDRLMGLYVETRKKECSGEFASLVISESGTKTYNNKKLSQSEKNLCNYLLINFRIEFNKKIFKVRKKYLVRVHNKQVEDLDKLKTTTLVELETLAEKFK